MKSYISFMKKEVTENWRTYKLLIMGVVFLLFGMMSPVLAKITPDIVKSTGLSIDVPTPTALDSWAQFFKNIGQIGLIVVVIVFCGIMANELSKGTLINVLTKGMRRSTVILSKFTVASVIWTLSYLLSLAVCYAYTVYFWPEGIAMSHAFTAFFGVWLYGELLLALVIFGGILFKNIYGSLLLAGGAVVVMMLINIAPKLQRFNPITLAGDNTVLLSAQKSLSDYTPALIVCAVAAVALIAGSVMLFNRKQL